MLGLSSSALVGIQTPNLLIRSQMLYSVELRVRFMNLADPVIGAFGYEFWTANVENKLSQPNNWLVSDNKKANFEPLFIQ